MDGWIKLHRQIIDTDDWLHEPFTRGQAWVDMLLLANHAEGSFRVRGIVVHLTRGQLGWSEETLAKRWKWSRGKVRRFFSELESETVQRIVQQKNNVSSVITILNYDKYQSDDTAERTPNGTTDGHQTDTKRYTNKNDKKNTVRVKKSFTPPTLEEVIEFCKEKGYKCFDCQKYHSLRVMNEWTNNQGRKILNWKADINTAESFKNFQRPKTAEELEKEQWAAMDAFCDELSKQVY